MHTVISSRALRALLVGALTSALSLVLVPSGLAATPDTPYKAVSIESPNPQAQGRWGERSALAGDINGDGVADFWITAFQEDVGAAKQAGRVYLISGKTHQVIYSVASPEPQSNQGFGFALAAVGDVNGDGKVDFSVGAYAQNDFRGESSPGVPNSAPCGAPEPNGCYERSGKAWVFDGATGKLLYAIANPQPQDNPDLPFGAVFGFGTAISSAGDINGDGIPDVLIGAASTDVPRGCSGQAPPSVIPAAPCRRDQGQAFVFSGKDGSLLRTYDVPPADQRPTPDCNTNVPGPGIGTCGLLGQTVQGVGDINGDGVTDHLVGAGTYGPDKAGRLYVFSGATGERLLTIDNPDPTYLGGSTRIFGLQVVQPGAPGDVNGDGIADVYGNGFTSAGPTGNAGEGRAWVFSGKDGSILYNLFDPVPEASSGFAFAGAKTDYSLDATLDGKQDELFLGQNSSGTLSGGGASIFGIPSMFGPNAVAPALKDFRPPVADRQPTGPPPANGLRFGRTVEAPGDLNGDCEPDYVIGAPFTDVGGNVDQGRVYLELSNGPSKCPVGQPPPPGARPGPLVTPAPSVSSYRLTNTRFAVGAARTPTFANAAAQRGKAHEKGTSFRYTLSAKASVIITISQRQAGRRAGKKGCLVSPGRLRRGRSCVRVTVRGALTRISHPGANSVAFSGRIGSRALRPGSYRATLVATDNLKHSSKPETLAFTILKR